MRTTDKTPTKKTRGDNKQANDMPIKVMQVLRDMLQIVQEQVLSSKPFLVFNYNENVEDGKNMTISNVDKVKKYINNKQTRKEKRYKIKNNVVVCNIPKYFLCKVLSRLSFLDKNAMEFFEMGYDSDRELPKFDCF